MAKDRDRRGGAAVRLAPLRRTVGIAVLALFAGSWIGAAAFWNRLAEPLAAAQLVPALLAGSAAVVAALLLATLLFGRIYCSMLCPLGLLQDAVSRAASIFDRRKKRRLGFAPAHPRLRLLFLALCAAGLPAGSAVLTGLLDPYSTFGRIGTHILAPFARVFGADPAPPAGAASVAAAWIALAVVAIMAAGWGRLYCNTVCPAGTLLGFVSRHALFRIRIEDCLECGRCETSCKAHCLDGRSGAVDASRCVACFNCLGACRAGRLAFRGPRPAAPEPPEGQTETEGEP